MNTSILYLIYNFKLGIAIGHLSVSLIMRSTEIQRWKIILDSCIGWVHILPFNSGLCHLEKNSVVLQVRNWRISLLPCRMALQVICTEAGRGAKVGCLLRSLQAPWPQAIISFTSRKCFLSLSPRTSHLWEPLASQMTAASLLGDLGLPAAPRALCFLVPAHSLPSLSWGFSSMVPHFHNTAASTLTLELLFFLLYQWTNSYLEQNVHLLFQNFCDLAILQKATW